MLPPSRELEGEGSASLPIHAPDENVDAIVASSFSSGLYHAKTTAFLPQRETVKFPFPFCQRIDVNVSRKFLNQFAIHWDITKNFFNINVRFSR